jgi:hypothetical protein
MNTMLVNPTRSTLQQVLSQTRRVAGLVASGDQDEEILAELASCTDGRIQFEHREQHQPARYLVVAWWSDYQQRKHVRICGSGSGGQENVPELQYSRLDEDPRPALWHVYPRTCYCVIQGKSRRWLVCCDCGEAGRAEDLMWMGPSCGVCHDREQDRLPVPKVEPQEFYCTRQSITQIAYNPMNGDLAFNHVRSGVRMGNLRKGSWDTLHPQGLSGTANLLFSQNGRFLFCALDSSAPVLVHDLERGSSSILWSAQSSFTYRQLACCSKNEIFGVVLRCGLATLWRYEADDWTEHARFTDIAAMAFANESADLLGDVMALAGVGGLIRLLSARTLVVQQQLSVELEQNEENGSEEVLWMHFLPDNERLLILTGCEEFMVDVPQWTLHERHLNSREERVKSLPPTRQVDVTADGRVLAYLSFGLQCSPGEITFFDLEAWRECGRIEWNGEDQVSSFAFTKDSATLIIATSNGVIKEIPWRRLLESGGGG